jgi:hypothetical protein
LITGGFNRAEGPVAAFAPGEATVITHASAALAPITL